MTEQGPVPYVDGDTFVIPIDEPSRGANADTRWHMVLIPSVVAILVLIFATRSLGWWIFDASLFLLFYLVHRPVLRLKGQTGEVRFSSAGLSVRYPMLMDEDLNIPFKEIKKIDVCPADRTVDEVYHLGFPNVGSVIRVTTTDNVPLIQVRSGFFLWTVTPHMTANIPTPNDRFTFFQWNINAIPDKKLFQELVEGSLQGVMPTIDQLAELHQTWGHEHIRRLVQERKDRERQRKEAAESARKALPPITRVPYVDGKTLVVPIASPRPEVSRKVLIKTIRVPLIISMLLILGTPKKIVTYVMIAGLFAIYYLTHRTALGLKGKYGEVRFSKKGIYVRYPALLSLNYLVKPAEIKSITCHPKVIRSMNIGFFGLPGIGSSVLVEMKPYAPTPYRKMGVGIPDMNRVTDKDGSRFLAFQWQPGSGLHLKLLQTLMRGAVRGVVPTPEQMETLVNGWGSDQLTNKELKARRRELRRYKRAQKVLARKDRPVRQSRIGVGLANVGYGFVERFAYLIKGRWFRKSRG